MSAHAVGTVDPCGSGPMGQKVSQSLSELACAALVEALAAGSRLTAGAGEALVEAAARTGEALRSAGLGVLMARGAGAGACAGADQLAAMPELALSSSEDWRKARTEPARRSAC